MSTADLRYVGNMNSFGIKDAWTDDVKRSWSSEPKVRCKHQMNVDMINTPCC